MVKNQLLNLGEFKLQETGKSEIFYVTVQGTFIFVTTQYPGADAGKIKVYHTGLYFGTPEQMYDWIENSVIEHLIGEKKIVQDGETMLGEKIWKWNI